MLSFFFLIGTNQQTIKWKSINRSASIHPCGHSWFCLKHPNLQSYGKCSVKKNNDDKLWKKIEEVAKECLKNTLSPCNRKFRIGHCEMKRQQVFFMYYTQWEAEPSARAWRCPGATLGSLSMLTFSCRGESIGNPWGFVHFYKCQPFNLQVDQRITLIEAPQQHVVQIHIEGKVALTFHNDRQKHLSPGKWWCA